MKELRELRKQLEEHVTDPAVRGVHLYPPGYSPPNILILKRKTVRAFNSSERVALYYSDKLQRYFTVPFTVGREDDSIDDVVGVSEDTLNESSTIIKPEELFHQPKSSKHHVGDMISYTTASGNQHKRGKVVEVGVNHVVVHRKEPGGGKYGYHYKVPHDAIVKEEKELNEISIPVATRAFHARQELGDKAKNKKQYRAAIYHYAKATKNLDRRAEKYKREDKGETVKEDVRHFPGHYGSVGSFATDYGYTFSHHDMGGNHIYKHPSGHRVIEVDDPNGQWHHYAPGKGSGQGTKGYGGEDLHKHLVKVHGGIKEAVIQEDAISHLQKVKAFQTDKPLYHKDGSQTKVDPTTANALLTVHDSLHPDNRKKFADHLEHSQTKFNKMLDFAWKSVK